MSTHSVGNIVVGANQLLTVRGMFGGYEDE